jgi:hypothetical protein
MQSPCCGQQGAELVTNVTGKGPDKPNVGDAIICFNCCAWLVVTATGFRLFDAEDFMRHTDDKLTVLRRLTALLKAFKKEHPNE